MHFAAVEVAVMIYHRRLDTIHQWVKVTWKSRWTPTKAI